MKKFVFLFLTVLVVLGWACPAFAQEGAPDSAASADEAGFVRGKIVSLDATKGQIVISPLSGDDDKTFTVDVAQLEGLEAGQMVRIQFDPATMTAQSIKRTIFKQGRWVLYGTDSQ